jgi:hypothetical protein
MLDCPFFVLDNTHLNYQEATEMFLSSILSKSDIRVRFSQAVDSAICDFAGTDKFAKALPSLELAIKLIVEIHKDMVRGCKFFKIDAEDLHFSVNLLLVPAVITGTADVRNRITKELEEDIIHLADQMGFTRADGLKTTFSNAQPYLLAAINMASLLRNSIDDGSKFYMVEPSGEKFIIKFL